MKINSSKNEEICPDSVAEAPYAEAGPASAALPLYAEASLAVLAPAEVAALEVLKETGVDILEAALVAKSALEAGRGRVKRARECISAGAEALRGRERTVSFERAAEVAGEEFEARVLEGRR